MTVGERKLTDLPVPSGAEADILEDTYSVEIFLDRGRTSVSCRLD